MTALWSKWNCEIIECSMLYTKIWVNTCPGSVKVIKYYFIWFSPLKGTDSWIGVSLKCPHGGASVTEQVGGEIILHLMVDRWSVSRRGWRRRRAFPHSNSAWSSAENRCRYSLFVYYHCRCLGFFNTHLFHEQRELIVLAWHHSQNTHTEITWILKPKTEPV